MMPEINHTPAPGGNHSFFIVPTDDEIRAVYREHGVELSDRVLEDYRAGRGVFACAAPKGGAVDPEDYELEPKQGDNGETEKLAPLTIRQPFEILAMEFDDSDFLLRNGYLCKGDPLAICGAASIGKSRLVIQLIIASPPVATSSAGKPTARAPVGF